ncbi:MAG: 4-hydroxythreonine-4-phosphate dehydrogenase PdxA [Verrucomicrobiota bacterium JB022]|nr:4-hydroxythreonine-4-phosphate dehydrogenase PdxA [Verrucomicrobiota bacterium JB022]
MKPENKPILAVTMGDPAGTGPELITKALVDPEILAICRPVVVGDAQTLRAAAGYTGCKAEIRAITDFSAAAPDADHIEVLDLQNVDLATLELGKVSPPAGQAAYEYIKTATEAALAKQVGAIVTSAINKESLNKAGHHYDGHTGLLSHLCKTPGATMMLAAEKLRVSHVSTHVSLAEAINRVRPERILKVLELTREAVQRLGIEEPNIAVAGLNPHAGEHGLFGSEEEEFIQPAIDEACRRGWKVTGPHPGDTVFFRAMNGEFDAAVAMYHDQGHVAVKMLGIWRGVNITLGLPIIRTSVEHGTNFDLAGTGRSDPRSLLAALKLAAQLAS